MYISSDNLGENKNYDLILKIKYGQVKYQIINKGSNRIAFKWVLYFSWLKKDEYFFYKANLQNNNKQNSQRIVRMRES